MKHFLFLLFITVCTSVVAIAVPFWGVLLYYAYATLRPQYLWDWSLSSTPQVRWSLTAGLVALVATAVNLPTILRSFRGNKVMVLLFVYAALMLLSLLTAYDPKVASFWVKEYGKVFLMAFIATLVIQRFWQVRTMGVMIALCLGYIAYEVNFLYFLNGGRLDIFHHGYGGLDNNGAGALLILGLPFAYFIATTPVGQWTVPRRIFGCLLGLAILHAVMMTYSRGAMLTGAVGLVWLLIHHRPRLESVAMTALLAVAISVMAGQEIRDRFASTANFETDASALSRFDSWSAAFDIALAHPLLGTGIRNSNAYSQNFGADLAGRTIHNQYLQIAADSGLPSAGVYIAMIGFGVFGLWHARRRCINAEQEFAEGPTPAGPHTREELIDRARDAATLCLGLQTALMMFAFSGMFLSVELVEVPWLLIVLSGILPAAVDRRLEGLTESEEPEDESDNDLYTGSAPQRLNKPVLAEPQRRAA